MPRISLETPHALGQEEALRRVKGKVVELKVAHQSHYSNLRESWTGSTLSFGFRAAGMKVSGSATVGTSEVKLTANLPLAAMLVKGKIIQRIQEELGALLS